MQTLHPKTKSTTTNTRYIKKTIGRTRGNIMETYAERLQKRKGEKMSNYDMDEIERERDRNSFASVKIGKPKEATTEVEIELSSDDLLTLTLAAHDRDITLNQLCNSVLRASLKDLDYRFEHQSKPQVLKEY